jgi:cAMP-specific phosphodiesterase 4
LTTKWPTTFSTANTPTGEVNNSYQLWDFNIWGTEKSDFNLLSMAILNQFNLPQIFDINAESWRNFMEEVLRLMTTSVNPYHNAHHIVDVLQSTSSLIKEFNGSKFLSDLDILALLVAAIIHDLEHPGTNNVYQVNAATPLAIRYNDMSVLENHHAAKAFEVFNSAKTNIFAKLTPEQFKYVRKTIIAIVLSTDMTSHFALKAELEDCYLRYQALTSNQTLAQSASQLDLSSSSVGTPGRKSMTSLPVVMTPQDTLTIMKSLLHAADISNPAKKWVQSKAWSDKVVEEFFAQGDREKLEGLPVSMNCDRNTTKQDELSVNFCDFIVAPFFFTLTKLLPKVLVVCKELKTNRTIWHNMVLNRIRAAIAAGGDAAQSEKTIASWEARHLDFGNKFQDLASKYDINPIPFGADETGSTKMPLSARRGV